MLFNLRSFSAILLIIIIYNTFAFSQSQPGGFDYNWANYPAGEFGVMPIAFDYTGIRNIEHVPAPYVHPRIFFGPSEIPEIRNRMLTTTSGIEVMKQIHAYTTLIHLSYNPGGYNHNSSYGLDAFGHRYIDNAGYWNSHDYYYKLIAQDPTALDGTDNKRKSLMASVMACEAYECLMYTGMTDPDTGLDYDDRAIDLATAMTYWATLVLNDPLLTSNNYNLFGGESMALCYDLNYNNMTTGQQDTVRMALAAIASTSPLYGGTTVPYATTSNWVGLNTFELIHNLAIEDETGYNSSLVEEYMRSYMNFLTYGWYESGVPYEGMGKNYQFVAMLVAMSKRGYSLLGHPHVKTFGTEFLPNVIQPYGHAFISTDVWGGTGWDDEIGGYKFHPNDVVGLKWAFPNEPSIDFVWRNYIEKAHNLSSTGYVYQQIPPTSNTYHNHLVMSAIFAQDYQTGNWETQNAAAIPNLDFFGPERGLAIFRSGHNQDAMMMHYHCRMDLGGHTHGDRNGFALSSLGRIWVPKPFGPNYQETDYHSCVLIDDTGIFITQKDGKKARQPGIVLDYQSGSDYSTVAGDATYAYSWEWHWDPKVAGQDHSWLNNGLGWTEVTETWNDFRYQQGPYYYHDTPFYDYADWRDGDKFERMIKRPHLPMNKVYRTAAMFKGNHPFVVFADDVEMDNNTHNYKWLMPLADDLQMESYTVDTTTACNHQMDIIIGETNGGTRKMLVRVLGNTGMPTGTNPYTEIIPEGNNSLQRLVIESNTVTADFKILAYTYDAGDPIPQTVWNTTKDELIVSIGAETNLIEFPVISGRTNIVSNANNTGDIDGDGALDFCDVCPQDAMDDSDGDGTCDSVDTCPGGNDFTDNNGNSLPDDCEPVAVSLTVLLEGPFNSSTNQMNLNLAADNLLPLTQPYNMAPYNYLGTESISGAPSNMVDWVLVEARTGVNSSDKVDTQVGLLLANGAIVGMDGASPLTFDLPANSSAYFVVRHRNHLDIMTANPVLRSLTMAYDFTTGSAMAYGTLQQKTMSTGKAAMFSGDITQDHVIQTTDFDQWKSNPAQLDVYKLSDINLDGTVQTTDYDMWFDNNAKVGIPEVGY